MSGDKEVTVSTHEAAHFLSFLGNNIGNKQADLVNMLFVVLGLFTGRAVVQQSEITRAVLAIIQNYAQEIQQEPTSPKQKVGSGRNSQRKRFQRRESLIINIGLVAACVAILDVLYSAPVLESVGWAALIYLQSCGMWWLRGYINQLTPLEMTDKQDSRLTKRVLGIKIALYSIVTLLLGAKISAQGYDQTVAIGIPFALGLFTLIFAVVWPWQRHRYEVHDFWIEKEERLLNAIELSLEGLGCLITRDSQKRDAKKALLKLILYGEHMGVGGTAITARFPQFFKETEEAAQEPAPTTE